MNQADGSAAGVAGAGVVAGSSGRGDGDSGSGGDNSTSDGDITAGVSFGDITGTTGSGSGGGGGIRRKQHEPYSTKVDDYQVSCFDQVSKFPNFPGSNHYALFAF